ncbi:hypothetical protein GCM10027275_23900 [Rhabdobacter roseus]|uniref:Type 1 periplasmic binding fold superfamily protein n=1 Tax=Rhabdobacter roseus TaxID=1655419 RepID=A0A840TWK8_9BACT|nr:hypothetical protein [Rhabdobacter roseus]MBB5284330.1 hypothetical protein [Rhabdobacter roseus]
MKMNQKLSWVLMLGATVLFSQCKNADNPEPEDPNELITTVRLHFTQQGTTTPVSFAWRDPDGEGGNPPTQFDAITLKANTTYTLEIELLDESKTPIEEITQEIEEKKEEHLFVFTTSPTGLLTYTYGDQDARGLPVGLTGTTRTGNAGTGTFKVQLRHQAPVGGVAVKDGTPGPGSDDVNLTFNLTVQ